MKYSKNFDAQFDFYFRMKKKFDFSGDYLRPKNASTVHDILTIDYRKDGVDAKQAFFTFESTGKLLPTKHPLLFHSLLKCKASANFHIKLYAQDRANGFLSRYELEQEIYAEVDPPQWFKDAVENNMIKFMQGKDYLNTNKWPFVLP